jgi:glycosyltransferase involved in cell wall biosynthesis
MRAINSVLSQTHPAFEIIVVDDGSTDGTKELLQAHGFCKKDTKELEKKYLIQENGGVSSARNLGVKNAKGDFIAFLDSDDAWSEKKLERQLVVLKQNLFKQRIIHTDEIWIRNGVRVNQHKKHEKSGGNIFEKCLALCCISPSSAMLHRSLFDEYGYFDETMPACEDYDMWLRLAAFEKVLFVPEFLTIKYGGHSDQLSRAHWGMDRFRVRSLEKLIEFDLITPSQRNLVIKTLIQKLDILEAGARKRKKYKSVREYRDRKKRWEEEKQFGN